MVLEREDDKEIRVCVSEKKNSIRISEGKNKKKKEKRRSEEKRRKENRTLIQSLKEDCVEAFASEEHINLIYLSFIWLSGRRQT